MNEVLENIDHEISLKLDKSKWKRFRFSELAQNIVEKVTPKNSDLTQYIGLEHLDSGSLKIRRFGDPKSLEGDKLKIYKGDIIFAKRNAYLKRAAVVEFDAVASAHSMVLRALPDNVLPEFFPFFLLSDVFWDRAIEISVGSLSPTINWKALARQEFLLPPKDQQARLAELLWAADEVLECDHELFECLNSSQISIFNNAVYRESTDVDKNFGKLSSKHTVEKLGDLIQELQYGISEPLEDISGVPILRMNNLQGGKLLLDDLKYFKPKGGELDRFMLNKGDLLFNRTNSFELVGKVSLFEVDGDYSFASYLIRIVVDRAKLDPRYLNYYLNSQIGMGKIRNHRTPGVSQSNINAQNLKLIPVPVPPIEYQLHLMNQIEKNNVAMESLKVRSMNTKQLQKSLINQVF